MPARIINENQKIELVPVGNLQPHPRNPRKGDVGAIGGSIRENGFYGALIVQKGTNYILAGNHRYRGAVAEGLKDVPVIFVDVDSDRALRILLADNKTSDDATYNNRELLDLLKNLEGGAGLMGTGYDRDDLDDLLKQLDADASNAGRGASAGGGGGEEPDNLAAAEELRRKWGVEPGQLWKLGDHLVLCGDSTRREDLARLMGATRAGLLHADPPYGMGKESDGVANDNLHREELDAFQTAWLLAARPFISDSASVYVWGVAEDLWRWWYRSLLPAVPGEIINVRNEVVWRKAHFARGQKSEDVRKYPTASERCLFIQLGEQTFNINMDNFFEGWEPIRSYLEEETKRVGWGFDDFKRITGVGMYSHWVTRSQWGMISAEYYGALQREAGGKAFARPYQELDETFRKAKVWFEEEQRKFYESRAYFDNTREAMTDVWDFPFVTGEERWMHATPKPVAMLERVVRASAPPGGNVLEPFLGSGSTLMACESTGRRCRAMELNPAYVAVSLQRWKEGTGKVPERVET